MKKFLLITLSCLLFASMTVPALAEDVMEIIAADGRYYEGYAASVQTGVHLLGDRHVRCAIITNGEENLLVAAELKDNAWTVKVVSATAVYQPGNPQGEYPNTPVLEHTGSGFTLSWGESEHYTFYYEDGEYWLIQAEYVVDPFYSNSYCQDSLAQGLLFWQSGPGKTFLPIGDALWENDGVTLEEFNITQTPRSMAEVRNLTAVSAALAEGTGAELLAATDTFLTDDPFASQGEAAFIPAGTALTGLAKAGEYYAEVEYTADGEVLRGYVPLKELRPRLDLAWGGDTLYTDARWDVIDALTGKWYPQGGSYEDKMILCNNGVYRTHVPGSTAEKQEVGLFRVYDREDGLYDLIIRLEDNTERRYVLTLNEDATITLTTTEGAQTFCRDEYSTYGNG